MLLDVLWLDYKLLKKNWVSVWVCLLTSGVQRVYRLLVGAPEPEDEPHAVLRLGGEAAGERSRAPSHHRNLGHGGWDTEM